MSFTSYAFLLFSAAVFLLYYILPKRAQWPLLLAASYIFYACSGPLNLCYILFSTAATYLTARRTGTLREKSDEYIAEHRDTMSRDERKAFREAGKRKMRGLLIISLIANLGMLAAVKYLDFAIANINRLLSLFGGPELSFLNIALPMGISFYVFKSVGYSIDIYRGKYKAENNFFKFALFVSFFPQLIQGPISRYDDLSGSLFAPHQFDRRAVSFGLQRVLWGFFKKLVIADRLAAPLSLMFGNPAQWSGGWAFVGMILYALRLYADFTGGIDITIGISEAMGIRVTENFIRPYFSKSIKEYWRRWHITMGTWFTDYIFYPLSVSRPMLKLSKFARSKLGKKAGKRLPVYISCIAVWLATGLWHGAGWNFIMWGLCNCAVILISEELEPLYRRFRGRFKAKDSFPWKCFSVIRTFLLMSCIRMFDCYGNVPLTFRMFGSMFNLPAWKELFGGKAALLGLTAGDVAILLCGVALLMAVSLLQRKRGVRERLSRAPYPCRFAVIFGLFIAVVIFGEYGVGFDANQFIYNRF